MESKAKYRGHYIDPRELKAADKQWARLKRKRALMVLLGPFAVLVNLFFCQHLLRNRFNEGPTNYLPQFPDASRDGWVFYCVPPAWRSGNKIQRFLWLFGNDEDGYLGDRRGYWSDKCGGNERSYWNMWVWAAFRNPVNNMSRYTDEFACLPNQCDIEYWGGYTSPDDHPFVPGWHFVKATDRITGKVFYGFRQVAKEGGKVMNTVYGFKLKPSHADEVQAPDDAHKGFTYRKTVVKPREGETQ